MYINENMSEKMDIDPLQKCTNNNNPSSSFSYADATKSGLPLSDTSSSSTHKTHMKGNDSNNKRKRDKPYDKHDKHKPKHISEEQFFNQLRQDYFESNNNAPGNNVENKDVAQQTINEKTANNVESSEIQPVVSRQRKSKGRSKNIDRNTINDVEQMPDDNSKPQSCQCHPPLIQIFPISNMNCCCYDMNQDSIVDFDEITSEDIPDNKEPIKPNVNNKKRRLIGNLIPIPPFFKSLSLYGYENESGSDNKGTKNSKTADSSTSWSAFSLLKSIKHLDPYYKETPTTSTSTTSSTSSTSSISHSHSNPHDNGFSHSSQSTAISNSTSNMSNSYESSSNNDSKDSLTKTSTIQYETPRSKPIHLLILHIAFGRQPNKPDINKCHSKGYHPIVKCFGNGGFAFQFVHDSIINCWANSWKVALMVSYDSTSDSMVYPFLKDIREAFESDILDIILIKSSFLFSYYKCQYLEITIADNKDINKTLSNVVTKAYRRNKYGGDDILFYNKDEPYYEFTNFYRAQVKIDDENWPTTEHYFQAAKFHNRGLRNKIRLAYTAREAFTIARTNDFYKRKEWESPQPPNGEIFKEIIMRHALFEKFMQHTKLRHKLLSTGKAKIYEHTENDRYWGDGGRNRNGLNRLGTMLQEIRNMLMDQEKQILINKYKSNRHNQKWVVTELQELQQFEDLIDLD